MSGINYKVATNASDLDKIVKSAIASYGRGRLSVQKAVIAVLIHAAKHGDYTQANALVLGLSGKTGASVAKFFRDFGGLSHDKDKKDADGNTVEGFNAWQGAEYITAQVDEGNNTRLDVAKATMFWDYDKTQDDLFRELSFEDMARSLINRDKAARKSVEQGKASYDETLSDTTRQAVLNLVKFDKIAA